MKLVFTRRYSSNNSTLFYKPPKGATRRGAKGAEAQSKLR